MSVPSSSASKIINGGTSPSPVEGIEVVPGPSSVDHLHYAVPQDGESEDYGDEPEEEEDESTEEEESEVRN